MFLALYTFIPKYCPQCGEPTPFQKERWQGGADPLDYNANAAHTCKTCGLDYQLAQPVDLLKAAKASGGDLHNYHTDYDLQEQQQNPYLLTGPELSRAVAARLQGYNP